MVSSDGDRNTGDDTWFACDEPRLLADTWKLVAITSRVACSLNEGDIKTLPSLQISCLSDTEQPSQVLTYANVSLHSKSNQATAQKQREAN